jgi:site-specific recombinase XerC
VSDESILEWMATLRAEGRKPMRIYTWLAGVRLFFTWPVRNHRLTYNPLNGIAHDGQARDRRE